MKPVFFLTFFFAASAAALAASQWKFGDGCNNNGAYTWIPGSVANTSYLEKAGQEKGIFSYFVGRAAHLDGVIPGGWSTFSYGPFWIAYGGQEIEKRDQFEVLQAMQGALAWELMPSGGLPNDPVLGGIYPTSQEQTFICRARLGGGRDLIVGNYRRSTRKCSIPFYNVVHNLEQGYEVLALTRHGRTLATTTTTNCGCCDCENLPTRIS